MYDGRIERKLWYWIKWDVTLYDSLKATKQERRTFGGSYIKFLTYANIVNVTNHISY